MNGAVGQRSATETLFGIVAAFVEKRQWTQADLARRLETTSETVRKHLGVLVEGGFALERREERPHVYWTAAKDFFPGVLSFKAEEAEDLVRLALRAPRGKLRERVVGLIAARLANVGKKGSVDGRAVQPPEIPEGEERVLAAIEDAARQGVVLKMHYLSTSKRKPTWRHASVHRVEPGARPQFVATCHESGTLRRFRVSGVLDAKLDASQAFRPIAEADLDRFDAETVGGFRADDPPVHCVFFVRDPEAAWVARNLPRAPFVEHPEKDGSRFEVDTRGLAVVARFVAGLGEAATPESPELAKAVADLARGALANAERSRSHG